jgi:MinD-like ATPase involved in chromosome partitioning or flagellar assembly
MPDVPDMEMPDVPAMEELPDPHALPDPGYPVMPTPASGPQVSESVLCHPVDGPDAQSWPRPPVWPPVAPTFTPAQSLPPDRAEEEARPAGPVPPIWPAEPHRPAGTHRAAESRQSAEPPQPAEPERAAEPPLPKDEAPRQVWSPDPYAAPRAPDDAPPLHGPSVPWAEVRAAADHEAAGEPLAAPPSLHERETGATRAVPVPPEDGVRRPTSDALTSDLLLPGKRATPDRGWRRTVYRATGGLVHIGESSASMRRRDLIRRVRTPVTGGHHRVAVLSLKGGVGKTTVTVGLGASLASLRGDRVIAVDGNPDRGTLSDKVRLETTATIRDLLNERAMVNRYADVRAFTSQAPSRLEILASDRDPGVSVAFSADDYRAVVGVLGHYYSICITDCGTGLLHSAMAGILELADQIVLVSSPSVDGARSASATLDWLEAHNYGDLVRGGVVALSSIRRKSKSTVDLDRLEQHFAARCRAVVRIPYDPHLEEGAEVELDYLNPETADAYLTLAALVADAFADEPATAGRAAPGAPLS